MTAVLKWQNEAKVVIQLDIFKGCLQENANGGIFIICFFYPQLHAEYNKKNDEYVHHRVVQAFETSQLIRFCQRTGDVLIFAGDFNCTPTDFAYRIIKFYGNLVDTYTDSPVKVSHVVIMHDVHQIMQTSLELPKQERYEYGKVCNM